MVPPEESENMPGQLQSLITNYLEAEMSGKGTDRDALISAHPELADELRTRFADWYYVISGADFAKLRPSRADLS